MPVTLDDLANNCRTFNSCQLSQTAVSLSIKICKSKSKHWVAAPYIINHHNIHDKLWFRYEMVLQKKTAVHYQYV